MAYVNCLLFRFDAIAKSAAQVYLLEEKPTLFGKGQSFENVMKRSYSLLVLVAVAAAIVGCGGSGGRQSHTSLENLLKSRLAGINDLPSAPGSAAGKSRPASRSQKSNPAATRSGDMYFAEEYQLWAEDFLNGDPGGEHTWGTHYYIDELATQPAGDDVWTSVWNAWPMTDDEDFQLTSGPLAGFTQAVHRSLNQDGSGTENADSFDPTSGRVEYSLSWGVDGLKTVDAKFTELDLSWVRYQGTPLEAGGIDYVITDSAGYRLELHYNADMSGTGLFTGPNEALPATIEWDETGSGTIHWSDGSVTNFRNWDF